MEGTETHQEPSRHLEVVFTSEVYNPYYHDKLSTRGMEALFSDGYDSVSYGMPTLVDESGRFNDSYRIDDLAEALADRQADKQGLEGRERTDFIKAEVERLNQERGDKPEPINHVEACMTHVIHAEYSDEITDVPLVNGINARDYMEAKEQATQEVPAQEQPAAEAPAILEAGDQGEPITEAAEKEETAAEVTPTVEIQAASMEEQLKELADQVDQAGKTQDAPAILEAEEITQEPSRALEIETPFAMKELDKQSLDALYEAGYSEVKTAGDDGRFDSRDAETLSVTREKARLESYEAMPGDVMPIVREAWIEERTAELDRDLESRPEPMAHVENAASILGVRGAGLDTEDAYQVRVNGVDVDAYRAKQAEHQAQHQEPATEAPATTEAAQERGQATPFDEKQREKQSRENWLKTAQGSIAPEAKAQQPEEMAAAPTPRPGSPAASAREGRLNMKETISALEGHQKPLTPEQAQAGAAWAQSFVEGNQASREADKMFEGWRVEREQIDKKMAAEANTPRGYNKQLTLRGDEVKPGADKPGADRDFTAGLDERRHITIKAEAIGARETAQGWQYDTKALEALHEKGYKTAGVVGGAGKIDVQEELGRNRARDGENATAKAETKTEKASSGFGEKLGGAIIDGFMRLTGRQSIHISKESDIASRAKGITAGLNEELKGKPTPDRAKDEAELNGVKPSQGKAPAAQEAGQAAAGRGDDQERAGGGPAPAKDQGREEAAKTDDSRTLKIENLPRWPMFDKEDYKKLHEKGYDSLEIKQPGGKAERINVQDAISAFDAHEKAPDRKDKEAIKEAMKEQAPGLRDEVAKKPLPKAHAETVRDLLDRHVQRCEVDNVKTNGGERVYNDSHGATNRDKAQAQYERFARSQNQTHELAK